MGSLKLQGVRKSFGEFEALKGIDLDISDGEFVVFVGPSGCGKSTLLRVIAGLEEHTAGHVLIDDRVVDVVPPAKRGIAMVFQTYALYPHLTVKNNMALGLKQAGTPAAEIERRIKIASAMLSLEPYLERRPAELSGGQRQRVAIGRAVVREPKLFLFDEPLSNLDAALRVNTRLEIAQLHRRLKATMIYVTHDQVEAMTLADKIVVLRDGRVEQVGSPHTLYHHPASQFVAGFIGSPKMNFLRGVVEHADASGVTVALAGGQQRVAVSPGEVRAGDAVTLGIRPEHLHLDATGALRGAVTHIESLGDVAYLHADCEAAPDGLVLRVPESTRLAHGSAITLSADAAHCHLFDAEGCALPRLQAQLAA